MLVKQKTFLCLYVLMICVCCLVECNDNLRVAYEWKEIDFNYPNIIDRQQAIESKQFIPENVIPVGLEVYKSRLFITLPRWKNGVPASLAYLDLNDNSTQSPKLTPYPSWKAHNFTFGEIPELVSPIRVRADKCGRLWVLDTGVINTLETPNILSETQLLIYDLHDDNLLRRFVFPKNFIKQNSVFANIAIDDGNCDETFAYAADYGGPQLIIYSWKDHDAWKVTHNYFHSDPLAGNYSIGGISFQWDDGLYGIALSKEQSDGYPMLYFHPLSSTMEFSVSTAILRNKQKATSDNIYKEFRILGSRGPNAQAGASFLDQLTGVLFYSLPNLNAIACWKTSNRAYTIKSQGRVYMSSTEMVYPNDVKVDDQDRLWVLSDRMHEFLYAKLNLNNTNFRVFTGPVSDAISNTACDTKTKPLPDLITTLGDILRPTKNLSTSSSVGIYRISFAQLVIKFFIIVILSYR